MKFMMAFIPELVRRIRLNYSEFSSENFSNLANRYLILVCRDERLLKRPDQTNQVEYSTSSTMTLLHPFLMRILTQPVMIALIGKKKSVNYAEK